MAQTITDVPDLTAGEFAYRTSMFNEMLMVDGLFIGGRRALRSVHSRKNRDGTGISECDNYEESQKFTAWTVPKRDTVYGDAGVSLREYSVHSSSLKKASSSSTNSDERSSGTQ